VAVGDFKRAVEAADHAALLETLAPDVVFRSPVVFKPYEGREAVALLLAAVMRVFEDFRYTAEVDQGERKVLMFETRVGDREIEGADFLRFDDDGLIVEFVVMVRPMSGVLALAEAMRAQLEQAAPAPAPS
jgi:hypothetical protein